MWLCGSTKLPCLFCRGLWCIHWHLGGCRLRMALRQAQPAWHTLSSGKSTLFYKEQVGEKAHHCRAHCAAVRGGIPPQKDRHCFENKFIIKTEGFLKQSTNTGLDCFQINSLYSSFIHPLGGRLAVLQGRNKNNPWHLFKEESEKLEHSTTASAFHSPCISLLQCVAGRHPRCSARALCFASCSVFRKRGMCFSLDGGSVLILKLGSCSFFLLLSRSCPLSGSVSSFSPSPPPWPPPWELRMASLLFFLLLI